MPHEVPFLTVKELGLQHLFPRMDRIYYGDCGSPKDDFHYRVSWKFGGIGVGAHTHICPNDVLVGQVCVSHKEEILNYDGSPADVLWHEYGHILTPLPWDKISNWKCVGNGSLHSFDAKSDFSMTTFEHGIEWQKTMRDLGRPDLNSSWVSPSIKQYSQAAAVITR